ncbi:unnamed protein product [Rhizophagus irregularis]|nr:unnamed protein product [Rhizophagus irregularis]
MYSKKALFFTSSFRSIFSLLGLLFIRSSFRPFSSRLPLGLSSLCLGFLLGLFLLGPFLYVVLILYCPVPYITDPQDKHKSIYNIFSFLNINSDGIFSL